MDQLFVLVLGVGFFVLSIIALLWPVRAPVRPCRHAQLVSSTLAVEALVPRIPLGQRDVVSDTPKVLQPQPDAEKAPVLLDQVSGDGAHSGDTTPQQKVVIQR